MITNATYAGKEQDWKNEQTRYWFNVEIDGENTLFAICQSGTDADNVLDHEGYPVDCNDELKQAVLESCIVTDEMIAE